jgi:murein DD-endopeptidase MepM/ murein hydrolase activator NlpD
MVSSIKNQKISKRKPKNRTHPKAISVSRPVIAEKFHNFKMKRKVRKWLQENKRKVSVYAASGLFLVFVGLFLSSSVPIAGYSVKHTAFSLPEQNEVRNHIFDYLEPETEGPQGEVTLPQGSILASIEPVSYTVKRGDTLSEISAEYGVNLGTLISFNGIQDVRRINAGSVLQIPNRDGVLYTVRRGDNLSVIAHRNGVSLNDILDANDLASSVIHVGQELFIPGAEISSFELKRATGELFIYPTKGRLSSPFGMRNDPFTGVRRMHYGIDITNTVGTPVVAAREGRVIAVGYSIRSYGNYVIIKHGQGFQSVYAHLSKISVSNGSYVRQGQIIGKIGNTGRSTGPHLHFGLYRYQNPIDPLEYLF